MYKKYLINNISKTIQYNLKLIDILTAIWSAL